MKHIKFMILGIALILSISGCKKFIGIDPPRTELIKSTVFASDATATAAMMDIYLELRFSTWASGSSSSLTFISTYSSDEQINYRPDILDWQGFNTNDINPENGFNLSFWSGIYRTIYQANAVIEGVSNSTGVSQNLKKQLEGEAKFIRAFCHFYLVNLWGDVPLILTTDYKANATKPRTPKAEVYAQIIADLKDAQILLPDNWAFANNERVRANKGAATAMLARIYLYIEDWANAEAQSTAIISNTGLYSLKSNLDDVFKTNSTEAILQWWSPYRPNDRITFRVLTDPPFQGALRPAFATSFEAGDLRNTMWVNLNLGYYNARKYKPNNDNPAVEYSTVLRLAEQFLIRAEARAKQNKLTGANSAESDINVIRSRALLPATTATTQAQLLLAVENERKWELFTEWGHRWLDLKRTNRATAVIGPLKIGWQPSDMLYPIPQYEILLTSLTQNPGY